jgi:hypothetical protein
MNRTLNRHDRVRHGDRLGTFLGEVWHGIALVVFDDNPHLAEVVTSELAAEPTRLDNPAA